MTAKNAPYRPAGAFRRFLRGALTQQGRYDVILPLDFDQMRETLEKKYGLRLEKQVKEVEVEVFEFR